MNTSVSGALNTSVFGALNTAVGFSVMHGGRVCFKTGRSDVQSAHGVM